MKSNVEVMAEIIPFVRAEIARELVSMHKMNQSEVSKMLGVSQPAISQYVRQLRGKSAYDVTVRPAVQQLCDRLINSRSSVDLENELVSLCKQVAQSRAN